MSNPPSPPPPPKTIIYIDGFNLHYGLLKGSPFLWLNLQEFFTRLRPKDNIVRIHYFSALIHGPTLADQQTYLRALATLPLANVILGNYKVKNVWCKVAGCTYKGTRTFTALEEKRTDVNIALQMLEDAYENRCARFILVSGDSDLVPAVNKVRALGKEVFVYIPARSRVRAFAAELRAAADRNAILPSNHLRPSQFPNPLPDGAGGMIAKPAGW